MIKWMLLWLLFVIYAAIGDTVPGDITITNFKVGGADYVIEGDHAVIFGNHVHITGVTATLIRENDEIRITTPACDFDQLARSGSSNKPVQVVSANLRVDGVGFDLDFNQNRILIRNNVKVRIYDYDNDINGDE